MFDFGPFYLLIILLACNCRPILDPIASIFDRALCGRSETSGGSRGQSLDETHLPGSDPIEALRRR